jgi:proteasome lid subunit RPN8/RPN11
LALEFTNGNAHEEITATLENRFSISVNVVGQSQTEPQKVEESTTVAPTAPNPTPSSADILWEQERMRGVAGMKRFLAAYKNNATYKNKAKLALVNLFRRNNKDAVPAAELFLQYFQNDALASEARDVIESQEKMKEAIPESEDLLEKAFREIMANPSGREGRLKEFIESHPDSKWAQAAKKHVPIKFTPQNQSDDGLRYEVVMDYALRPQIVEISDSALVEVEIVDGVPPTLYIKLLEEGNYYIKLLDDEKDPAYSDFELELGNVLTLVQLFPVLANSDTLYALRLLKGNPPFRIDFFRDNQYVDHFSISNTDTLLVFHLAEMKEWLGPGQFKVEIVEERRGLTYSGGTFKIPSRKIPWLLILASLALLTITISVNFIRKKLRLRNYEKKLKTLQSQSNPPSLTTGALTTPQLMHPLEIPETATTATEPLNTDAMPQASNLVIKSHKKMSVQGNKSIPTEADFALLLNTGHYFQFSLNRLWQDTVLSDLYFSKNSILNLDAFLRTQYVHELSEKEGSIPEIGGFLLGKHYRSEEEGRYRVLVEEFVPVMPHSNNVYKLEFSTSGIVQELGMAQEKFPDLTLVAWFHTHPGHGLFLSSPDLTIHEGFFKEEYQFAMEIDSLKENLDTGFFTRQKNGSMNNAANLDAQAAWFSWRTVEQAARAMA